MISKITKSANKTEKRDDSKSKLNEQQNCGQDEKAFVPPDGGYGWVVVFASFMTHLLTDGIIFTFGVFYLEFLDYFKTSKSSTASLGALLSGICLLTAPVAAAIVNKYECRVVVIVGSIISSISFILCTFSPSIEYMMLTYGICGGFGFGLMYLPMVVSVSYYFDKKRAIATGIAVCGSGVGTILFAPFGRWLLEMYDWKNAMYIMAALSLNGILLGTLLRPIKNKNSSVNVNETHKIKKNLLDDELKKNNSDHEFVVMEKPEEQAQATTYIEDKKRLYKRKRSASRKISECSMSEHKIIPLQRKDIFYSGSVLNIPEYSEHANMADYTRSTTSLPRIGTEEEKIENEKVYCCNCIPVTRSFKETLSQMTDLSLLKDPAFALIMVGNFLASIGVYIPFVYIAERAISLGISENNAAFLLSVIGISNTVGRLLSGALANIPRINTLLLHNIAITLAGVICLLNMFFTSFTTICVFAVVFGFCYATWISVTPPILCTLLGLERLTNAFGLLVMVRGIATLIGTPLAGFMYDLSQDFDVTFHLGGVLLFVGGVFCFFLHLPCLYK